MRLTIGFSSLGCPDLSLEEICALATRHHISAVELRALGGSLDLPEYLERRYGSPAALAENLRGIAVSIASLDTSLRLMESTPADREKLLRFVPWAEAMGAPRLRVFDGGQSCSQETLAHAIGVLGWWRDLRREHGWRTDLMVETHDTLLTTAAIQRFLAAAPGTAILWDTHHTWKKGGEDPVLTWRSIGSSVCHVHVKDSLHVPGREPYVYVLPGSGEFPMGPLVAALQAGKFAGPVCLEWEKLWHPALAPLDEALTAARRLGWWNQTPLPSTQPGLRSPAVGVRSKSGGTSRA